MCGIYGVVSASDPLAPDIGSLLERMDQAIVHRGPDDTGSYLDARCAMGMRRLAIIDVQGGRQPIANEDRRIWTVFNGEIYNYRALRRDLQSRGHRFASGGDTEVLVHLYEEQGPSLLPALDGMFALAIWDSRREELLLARDRLGIKPLYFAELSGALLFASELKSLLAHPSLRREISPAALSHYLTFGVTPIDQSILSGVHKLAPGHLLRWRSGLARVERWWDLSRPSAPEHALDPSTAATSVRHLIREAVRSHLESDVPVGAFLSGGIDSATVVGTMVELGARPKTFSIGFDHDDFDELRYARLVAHHFQTDHHELVVRPDVWDLADTLVWHLDEPFADVSAIPTFLVARLAAEQVKVVLSGDGGDEVFAGYDRYPRALRDARFFDRLPPRLRRLLGRVAQAMPEAARGKHYLRYASLDPNRRYVDETALFQDDLKARLLLREESARCAEADDPTAAQAALHAAAPGDALSRLLYLDTMRYLPLDILTKVDRMTMACSLEARPPLLDHRLVEAVFAMPSALKLDGTTQKAVLKRAVADLLPRAIVEREKRGFGVPIRHWFRGPLREPVHELLFDSRTVGRGLFDVGRVRALEAEHLRGRRDQSLRLWALVVLELWCRRFLDPPARALTPYRPVPEVVHA